MEKSPDTSLIRPVDMLVAGALLTRLPLPYAPADAFARQAQATWAYPVIGALLALLAALVWSIAAALGLPQPIVAVLTLASIALMTGALHEDGLADMFDGLWGGHEPARRLEIMKDSAIGSYGVLALIIVFTLKWSAASGAGLTALAAAMCLSRAVLPAMMHLAPQARKEGLAAKVGTPPLPVASLVCRWACSRCSSPPQSPPSPLSSPSAKSAASQATFWARPSNSAKQQS